MPSATVVIGVLRVKVGKEMNTHHRMTSIIYTELNYTRGNISDKFKTGYTNVIFKTEAHNINNTLENEGLYKLSILLKFH